MHSYFAIIKNHKTTKTAMKKQLIVPFLILSPTFLFAQLDNLEKEIKNEINRRVEQKINKSIDKGLDRTEEAIEDAVTGNRTTKRKTNGQQESKLLDEIMDGPNNTGEVETEIPRSDNENSLFTYSTKYDFVPGNSILIFEDFKNINTGSFPSTWNTNGTGEVVEVPGSNEKWLKLRSSSIYIPEVNGQLNKDFTIEFDLVTEGITEETSEGAFLTIILDDNNTLGQGNSMGKINISLCQSRDINIGVESRNDGVIVIKNSIQADIRKIMLHKAHISIAVNNQQTRFWLNGTKHTDIPRFLTEGNIWFFKLELNGLNADNGENLFISNLKIAKGSNDIKQKLTTEGQISTSGILFPFDSDKVKPESYGVLSNVAQVLKSNPDMKLKIVGHTDSDGIGLSNLDLSMRRAESVKNILVKDFHVNEQRLVTDGKGESQPVVENDTPAHKAENRRVEFIKM